jgi:uncharacterized metal-binding protein
MLWCAWRQLWVVSFWSRCDVGLLAYEAVALCGYGSRVVELVVVCCDVGLLAYEAVALRGCGF